MTAILLEAVTNNIKCELYLRCHCSYSDLYQLRIRTDVRSQGMVTPLDASNPLRYSMFV